MQIGQFARQAGVAIDTVRYYERQGLPYKFEVEVSVSTVRPLRSSKSNTTYC